MSLVKVNRRTNIRPLTDEERDRVDKVHKVARAQMVKYDHDTQQDALVLCLCNWVRNRHKCPDIKDSTFIGKSAIFQSASALRAKFSKQKLYERNQVSLVEIESFGIATDVVDTKLDIEFMMQWVRKKLWNLPRDKRQVMRLILDGYTQLDVSKTMSMPKGSVFAAVKYCVDYLIEERRKEFNDCH